MNEHKFPYPLKCIRTFVKKKWMCILAIRINVLWIDLTAKESFEHEILFKLSFPKLLALFIYKVPIKHFHLRFRVRRSLPQNPIWRTHDNFTAASEK
ncbi:hypothetical protein RCL_jg5994.t1 [Rhizophagus clarus]|uniref:Uncharacterized protein n=1 Tax=Rhizophagus clarus TaxID=94130 RepID=A0A8H3LZ33_9GLOM|nr:hypothetical protein RCL_jg5994.t1 [Rhizophagus clarus]